MKKTKPKKTKPEKEKQLRCKKCGAGFTVKENPPLKTWTMVSPMPDKMGRVTITVMGSFRCPECQASVRTSIKKIKGDVEGKSKKEEFQELISSCKEPMKIDELAAKLSMAPNAVSRALVLLIKRDTIKGKVKDDLFIPG